MEDHRGRSWRSLADFTGAAYADKAQPLTVRSAELTVVAETPQQVQFTLKYNLDGSGAARVTEEYTVTRGGIDVLVSRLDGPAPAATRLLFPALVSDGVADTTVTTNGARADIVYAGNNMTLAVSQPAAVELALEGPRVPTHNGFVRALAADLPAGATEVHWTLRLSHGNP